MAYIVVIEKDGVANFLQYRKVVNWFFDNNSIRVFLTLKRAILNAKKQNARVKASSVRVLEVDEDAEYSCSSIKELYETDKEKFIIKNS